MEESSCVEASFTAPSRTILCCSELRFIDLLSGSNVLDQDTRGSRDIERLARSKCKILGSQVAVVVLSAQYGSSHALRRDDYRRDAASRLCPVPHQIKILDRRAIRQATLRQLPRRHLPAQHRSLPVVREAVRCHRRGAQFYYDVRIDARQNPPQP